MSADSRFVRKGSATHAAHVRFLPCVDPLMPLKSIELGELFVTVFTVVRPLTCTEHIRKARLIQIFLMYCLRQAKGFLELATNSTQKHFKYVYIAKLVLRQDTDCLLL